MAGDYYPFVVGGLPLHVRNLSVDQASKGLDVTVLTFGDHDLDDTPGLKVIVERPYYIVFGNRFNLGFLRKLFDECARNQVVHAHSHLYLVTAMSAIASAIRNVPLVITNHGYYSQSVPMFVQRIFLRTVALFSLGCADRVICYTENEKRVLAENGVAEEKIVVIHNGIDTQAFHPQPDVRKEYDLLWVGRMAPGKDPLLFLDVLEGVKKKMPSVKAVMIGEGPLRGEVERTIRELGLQDNIRLMDNIDNEGMADLYPQVKILVITSRYEGVPRIALEAMSSCVPVISTWLPQLKEVVGEGGMVIEKDWDLVAPILRLLSDDQKRNAMGDAGRRWVENNYSWSDTVDRIDDLYADVLGLNKDL